MPLSEREQRLLDQIERALSGRGPETRLGPPRPVPAQAEPPSIRRGRAVFAIGLVLLVLGVGITSLSSTAGFLWLSAIGFLLMLGGAVLAVASVGPIRKASPAAPGKPHRHWFSGRLDGRLRRPFEQE